MIKSVFINLALEHHPNVKWIEQLWTEIETTYSNPKRHYHTLHHLEHLTQELECIKDKIQDWNTVLFSVFYHDLVYNPLRRDNEERSAAIAEHRLHSIDVPADKIAACKKQILATQKHIFSGDNDTDLFTDADLSILGKEWTIYKAYAQAIRKEYALYPDLIYKPGRKEVVQHFLQMEKIFKTEPFFAKYEKQARQNLQWELEELKMEQGTKNIEC
jgi:predicted metal-dependent HD superfamily phosphohydrolase